MKHKHKLIFGAVALILIAVICCTAYSHHQKNTEYSHELSRVKASLEQIVQHSEGCVDSILSGSSDEKHGYLMLAVNELDSSVSKIALLYNGGSLSRYIFELSDHLNGTYPNLPNETKIYWLNCIKDASEEFLSVLEQNPAPPFTDFGSAVQRFSSKLPTYE